MDVLFPALETKFEADVVLNRIARRMYQGAQDEITTFPYVTVERTDGDNWDTYGRTGETFDLTFTLKSKFNPNSGVGVNAMAKEFRRVFDNVLIVSDDFSWVETEMTGIFGPTQEDSHFEIELDYTITLDYDYP